MVAVMVTLLDKAKVKMPFPPTVFLVTTTWSLFLFFNDPATPDVYALAVRDALPVLRVAAGRSARDEVRVGTLGHGVAAGGQPTEGRRPRARHGRDGRGHGGAVGEGEDEAALATIGLLGHHHLTLGAVLEIGRASCRER